MDYDEIRDQCNAISRNTLMETLDIRVEEVGDDYLVASMPVNPKVHQPDGVLHGGATAALAESVGSFAAYVFLREKDVQVRGLEITANHLKSVQTGKVFARADFVHKGRTTQIIQIRVTDEQDRLISICKLNTIRIKKP